MKLNKFGTYCLTLLVYFSLFFLELIIVLRYKDGRLTYFFDHSLFKYLFFTIFSIIGYYMIVVPTFIFLILLIEWLKIKWFASLLTTFILHNFFFVYVLGEVHAKDRPEVELMMMFIPLILNGFIIWLLFRNTFKRLDAEDNLGYIPFRSTFFKN